MSTKKTARFVRRLTKNRPDRVDARLYECNPPHEGHRFVIASAATMPGNDPSDIETYLFPSDGEEVTGWGEMIGSQKGTLDHRKVWSDLGYEVVEGPQVTYTIVGNPSRSLGKTEALLNWALGAAKGQPAEQPEPGEPLPLAALPLVSDEAVQELYKAGVDVRVCGGSVTATVLRAPQVKGAVVFGAPIGEFPAGGMSCAQLLSIAYAMRAAYLGGYADGRAQPQKADPAKEIEERARAAWVARRGGI